MAPGLQYKRVNTLEQEIFENQIRALRDSEGGQANGPRSVNAETNSQGGGAQA